MTLYFHNEPWEFAPQHSAGLDRTYWNLWRTRREVFGKLAAGDHVVLVRTWPSGSTMVGVLVVTHIDRGTFERKTDAIKRIAQVTRLTPAKVRSEPYTKAKPDLPGYFIAWTGRPVARLDLPRPVDLRFGGDGWLCIDDQAVLKRWGLDGFDAGHIGRPVKRGTTQSRGQGRRLDVAARDAVEDHAMARARQWCADQGYAHVADVSAHESWDLEAGKSSSNASVFIEVKGTTGAGTTVEVTAAEVSKAREHGQRSVMIVVSGIDLTMGPPANRSRPAESSR